MDPSAVALYAELYDTSGVGWPGELDFYRALAAAATTHGERVLEVACGTGRVAIPLARDGASVTGFDRSPDMLRVARAKSGGMPNPRWVEADMRSVALGEAFGLILIPAHAFQSLLTPDDQVACLECLWWHLTPDGTLVVHLDHQDLGLAGCPSRTRSGNRRSERRSGPSADGPPDPPVLRLELRTRQPDGDGGAGLGGDRPGR